MPLTSQSLASVGLVAALFMTGCAARFYCDPPEIAADQQRTRAAFHNYCQYGQLKDWQTVQNAAGASEIPATRVFQAFTQYSLPSVAPDIRKQAEQELLRNPQLSLSLLKPLAYECKDAASEETDAIEELPAFRNRMRDLYIGLCQRVAAYETDGFAGRLLQSLAHAPAALVAEQAQQALEQLASENCHMKSQRYVALRDQQDLQWIAIHCLRAKMTRREIESLLGDGELQSTSVRVYRGGEDFTLTIFFRDNEVVRWEPSARRNDGTPCG